MTRSTLTILALINNARAADVMQDASRARGRSDALFTASEQNAELVQAMGMNGDLARRWTALQLDAHHLKTRVADRIASFSVLSKTIRMALQSGMLGLGAAFFGAFYTVLTRRLAGVDSTNTQQLYSGMIAVLILLPLAYIYWQLPEKDWHWLLFATMGCMGWLGHQMLTAAHRYAPAAVLAPFMPRIFSADLGLTKPDPRAYQKAAELLGHPPAEVLVVDDAPVNTATAASLGFATIDFTDAEQLAAELETQGLL